MTETRATAARRGESFERESLGSGEVHVWTASLDAPGSTVARLRALLDAGEQERADRFLFEDGRRQFTVGRGVLRVLLGRYLAIDPRAVRFRYNAYGKPMLAEVHDGEDLQFNLSHSGSVVVYAFARGRELGIDVESIRPDFATEAIAQRFFAPAEVAALRGVADDLRTQAFFTCWTRKEAFIKARGKGLSIPLDAFEVSLVPGAAAAILVTHDDAAEAPRWSLHDLHPGPGYVGALAVAGPADTCRTTHRTWTDEFLEELASS